MTNDLATTEIIRKAPAFEGPRRRQPLVSAIVSTYNSEAFMRGCLEDLEAQTLRDHLEIIVVDSHSPQNERQIVEEFQERFDNITYVRTTERESVYQAWNRGIRLASGTYVTNANTDDRHDPTAFERMVDALEGDPEIMLVYADQYVTDEPIVSFEACRKVSDFIRPDFHRDIMLTGCHMGSQPMWRRAVHASIGYFDERFTSASDYEFWCRMALRFPMLRLPMKLGAYYRNPNGIEISNPTLSIRETETIKAMYAPLLMAPADAYRLAADRRFKFLLPCHDSAQREFMQAAIRDYLSVFPAASPALLVLWLSKADEIATVEGIVSDACRDLGLLPDSPFGDIEVVLSEMPGARLPEAMLDAVEAVIIPRHSHEDLVTLAEARGLPVVHDSSAERLRALAEGWDPAAIDIVLLTHNRLDYLRQTVDTLYARTSHPFRLLIVDNASDADVQEYLSANRSRFHRVIRNPENRWTQAFTQGIALTRSDPFIVSDPDILVPDLTPCWLERQLELMGRHPEMGMVALNLDASNKPARLPDVYVSEKAPHGPDLTLSYVGTVMQTIRRAYFLPPYTTDWHAVEAIRGRGGLVGFANHLVAYHLGWNEDRDYPEHLVKKHQYFNRAYGSDLYKLYTQEGALLRAMDGRGEEPRPALTSIVMLTWNQVTFTQLCIESVYKHTPEPFELIVVDNGSTDETVTYLEKLASEHENVKLVLNPSNRGYAGGNNQGLALAKGETIVLLNNDTVVSPGWLSALQKALERDGVGVAGPCSNSVVGPQLVSEVPYDRVTLEGMEAFTRLWAQRNRDRFPESRRVVGFCMAIRRDVIEQIGGLDPSFGIGNLEDDDFCLRVYLAGYSIVIAMEAFVHHFGSVTFKGQGIDYSRLMDANWGIFKAKYGIPADAPLELGYRHSDIVANGVTPQAMMIPLFPEDVSAVSLPDGRGFNIVLSDRDDDRLKRSVAAYLQAFGSQDDVALHLLAGHEVERHEELVLEVIQGLGMDPEAIPDLSILDAPVTPLEVARYLKAADLVVGSPDLAQGARDLGVPAFVDPRADLLRLAFGEFGAIDWGAPALRMRDRNRNRWLLTTEDWEAPLRAFLNLAKATPSLALYVKWPGGEAANLFEALSHWLQQQGYDLEQIPDIVVLDQADAAEISAYRFATGWMATGDLRAETIARALGLQVIELEGAPKDAAEGQLSSRAAD